jgi:drug/metabolite transporter (DMT)-like permease
MSTIPFFGEICGLLTAMFWSGSSLVFSAATVRVGSVLVNISRLIFALGFLVPVLLVLGCDTALNRAQLVYLGTSGVIGLAVGDSFLFRAYRHIGPRIAMLVMSASPAIAAVLAYVVLDERLPVLGVVGVVVTLTGIAIVVNERRLGPAHTTEGLASGVLFAFLAAITQGVGLIFAKLAFLEGTINGFVATALRISAALLVLLPVMILLGRVTHPVRTFANDRKALGLTLLGSVLGPFLGISASLMAVAYTTVGVSATLMATVPIIMLPMVRIIHKERLTWGAIAGAFVAVGGVVMLFLH